MNFPDNPSFVIKTLGCKVNQYESQTIRENLIKNNFIEKRNSEIADFYIINSCTVTHKADKDTRNLIHHFNKINPKAKIVVAGCYAELKDDRKTLANIPGVTYLVRNSEKEKIAAILIENSKFPACPAGRQIPNSKQIPNSLPVRQAGKSQITNFEDHNRAFIKIQDGCNHKCSFCKVNIVRGPSRSRNAEYILEEIRIILGKGFKEIVLTGICLGAWGRDLEKQISLAGLVKEISHIEGMFRIRLSSIEPIYVADDIIELLRENNKVCKHLHIPLQSGDDKILKLMHRPYNTKKIEKLIQKIRKHIPDVAFTTDILVGFPGEGNREFRNTLKFIAKIKPSRIHIFSYSRRDGTQAAKYEKNVDRKEIKERTGILFELGNRLSTDFAKSFIGKYEVTVIENYRDKSTNLLTGYTNRYIRVLLEGPDTLKNKLIPLKITRLDGDKNTVFAQPGYLDNSQII